MAVVSGVGVALGRIACGYVNVHPLVYNSKRGSKYNTVMVGQISPTITVDARWVHF